jgi:Raf kinase inhibitor-like YbhB/YbcL family protein
MERLLGVCLSLVLLVPAVGAAEKETKMTVTSPAFKDNEPIPDQFTCHGSNISPEINIAGIPPKTQSLAMIVDDIDAPEGDWVHWVVFDIPPKTAKIAQNSKAGIEGLTDFGTFQYRGPCPANKRVHRYSFRVYALSDRLELPEGFIKSDLLRKMKGKVLSQAELIGTYKNPDRFNE